MSGPLLGGSFGRSSLFAGLGEAEFAGLRRVLWQRLLDGVAHRDPAARMPRHRTLDEDQSTLDVRLDHAPILRRHLLDAEMAGHLLVLPGLAGVLTAAGRTMRTMRNRN